MIKKFLSLLILTAAFSLQASDLKVAAEEALMSGDMESALQAYVGLLEENPDDTEALDLSVMLAQELGLPDFAMELLSAEVDRAISVSDKARAQSGIMQLTEVYTLMPAWVDERLAVASEVLEAQMEGYQTWEALSTDAQLMMDSGDFEAAAEVVEGAFLLAQELFGEGHWITIASTRDMGFVARQLGDAESADAFYNDSYAASVEVLGDAHPRSQHIAELIAELFSAVGAPEEALMMREMVTANYEAEFGASHSLTLESMMNQVSTFQSDGDYQSAVEMLTGLCGIYSSSLSPYHPNTIDCDLYLADLQRNAGSLEEAEKILQSVTANLSRSSTGINEVAIGSLMKLADIHEVRGEYQVAKDLLSGLIVTAGQIGESDLAYTGKNYLARILASEGDLDNAQMLMEDVVAYGRNAWGDLPVQYYNAVLTLGSIYQRQSRLADAEDIFEESMMALLEVAGELHPSTLVAMNNLGNIYEQLGLYDESEPLLKQTLAGMETAFGLAHPQTARTRNNLALLHESQGNFREAEPLYLTSLEFTSSEFGENHPQAIAMQNNLAYLYMMMEDYESALAMFEDLVERWSIAVGADHQDALKSRNNLGRVYRRLGRLDEAEQTVAAALFSRREVLGAKHIDTIRSLIDLGAIYLDQSRLDDAERELKLALSLAEEAIGDQHPYTFEALNNLAKVLEAQGSLDQAVELRETGLARRSAFLDRMLWVTGENAREGYIRLHQPELYDYLALLTRTDDPDRGRKAIEASLQRKGLLLKITSEIEQISQLSKDPKLSSISSELDAARKDLAALTLSGPTAETQGRHVEALYALEQRVNELQGELGRASVRFRSSIAGVTAAEMASTLEEGSAFVDFLMYNDEGLGKVLAGVITHLDGDITYDLVEYPDREEIEASVLEFREIIQDDLADEDELLEIGQIAYDLVWAPIVDTIGDVEYVYLVPDGVLNILPFNALLNEDEEYLIQTTDVHILTSGRDLLPNEYQLAQGEYVILAGPDYNSDQVVDADVRAAAEGRRSAAMQLGIRGAGGGLRGLNFAPLPGAEKEGRIITDRVDAREEPSDVYFGERAQEQVLATMTEIPEILHIATHGFFLEADDTLRKRLLKMQRSADIQVPPPGDNPLLRAGLAFAGINTNAQLLGDIDTVNDGVLTALEVLGLDLSGTRLVVLSACETGLGEIHEGEGVYGLRRSFQEAGVAEVISSLWEVSDAGTQALMTDLYDKILDGTPAREALRDAQLEMIDSPEWGYPYIWSAFMIVGSYESAGISVQ